MFALQNISIALVGKNEPFRILTDEENNEFVSAIERRTAAGSGDAAADAPAGAPAPGPDGPPGPGDDAAPAVAMEFH